MAELDFGKEVVVFFVLGGPGAGKGTQCALLAQSLNFCHLSAGDLLRLEKDREGSPHSAYLTDRMMQGKVVSAEVILAILKDSMKRTLHEYSGKVGWGHGKGRFLIDGFPRTEEQARRFESEVCVPTAAIVLDTTEDIMLQRVLHRGQTSGRLDDNEEILKKRLSSYRDDTQPTLEYLRTLQMEGQPTIPNVKILGKVAQIDSTRSPEVVNQDVSAFVNAYLG